MAKKTPLETPRRKKSAESAAELKKTRSKKVETASAETGTQVKTALAAKAPKITPQQIVDHVRKGNFDSSAWAGQGYTVEVIKGRISVWQRVGCVTKKLIDGEPLKPALPAATEPAAESTESAPSAPNPATTADTIKDVPAPATADQPALAPVAPAPAPAQPVQPAAQNGNNEGNGRKLPPPPPLRRKTPPLGTLVAPAAAEPIPAAAEAVPAAISPAQPAQAQPAEPSVIVPVMEAPTIVIPVVQKELIRNSNTPNEVTIFTDGTERLALKVKRLTGQADLLLRNGELESGADTATIINIFEGYEQQAASLERFYLSAQLSPDQRELPSVKQAIAIVRELNGKIKEKLLALRAKQNENGETEQQMAVIDEQSRQKKTLLTAGGVAAAIAVVLGSMVIAKKCTGYDVIAESEQPNATASAVTPDSNQTNIAPLPPEIPEQTLPPAETPAVPTQPEPTPEPPAKKTATFNCELDTTDQAKIKCVDSNAPDAEVTESLAWAGAYNSETQTVPAKVTLTTPDGEQFETTFDAQVDTRQQLSFTLEALEAK